MSQPVASGRYPRVSPYLVVEDGDRCLEFLCRVLGGQLRMDHRDEAGRLRHAEVVIGDSLLMLAEGSPEFPARPCDVHMYVDAVDEIYRRALEWGAHSVQAPVRKQDPDRRAGVRDGSGITWWLATRELDHDPVDLAAHIRTVRDFPRPGIGFKDITPLLADPRAFDACIHGLADAMQDLGATRIAGIESRGFLFGAALARGTGLPFIPLRKPGKLPWNCRRVEYALEYGTDALEIHEDGCGPGDRVLLLDDLLATGGTVLAAASLVRGLGAEVAGALFVIELGFLPGRSRLEQAGIGCRSLLCYSGEGE